MNKYAEKFVFFLAILLKLYTLHTVDMAKYNLFGKRRLAKSLRRVHSKSFFLHTIRSVIISKCLSGSVRLQKVADTILNDKNPYNSFVVEVRKVGLSICTI